MAQLLLEKQNKIRKVKIEIERLSKNIVCVNLSDIVLRKDASWTLDNYLWSKPDPVWRWASIGEGSRER